jgi:hypothetical protein
MKAGQPSWEKTLELKAQFDALRKRRSMIFQIGSKEEAARAFGKPLDFYYHFSYEEWSKVSRRLVRKRLRVMAECVKLGIPGNMPFNDFPHYRKKMGLNT